MPTDRTYSKWYCRRTSHTITCKLYTVVGLCSELLASNLLEQALGLSSPIARPSPTQCSACKIRQEKKQRQTKRLRWINNRREDVTSLGLRPRGAVYLTNDRGRWRSFIRTHRRQIDGVLK